MAMNSYVDEPLDVMCEGLFDNIEDFLDFPIDDHDDVLRMVESGTNGDSLPSKSASVLSASSGEGSRVTATSEEDKICDDINIPEDWFSKFLDDTDFNIDFPAATTIAIAAVNNDYKNKDDSLFQSFSPISVLEPNNLSGGAGSFSSSSSSSSSISVSNDGDTSLAPPEPTMLVVPARARTKRPRPASFSPRSHVTLPFLPPSSDGAAALPESESFSESSCTPPMKKKKKKSINTADTIREEPVAIRKCMHCEIQKTPQWRAGPMGPKTLCNACGVRYKSGRLFPEYRPAASPTFVPTVHSNSHKKVVEMRIMASQKAPTGMPSPECPAAKSCDLLEYIRRKE